MSMSLPEKSKETLMKSSLSEKINLELNEKLKQILDEHVKNTNSQIRSGAELKDYSRMLSNTIRDKLKKLENYSNYRIVTQVTTTNNSMKNNLKIAKKCLWSPEKDSFGFCVSYNNHFYCIAHVFLLEK
jgi:hypothetical protein